MAEPITRRSFLRLRRAPVGASETDFARRPALPVHRTSDLSFLKGNSLRSPNSSAGLEPYSGTWDVEQVAHLLRRTMFGAKNTDVHNFLEMSVSAAVDKLLEELPQPPPPINDYGNDPFVPPGQTWIDAPMSNGHEDKRTYSLKGWWLGNMLDQPTNIREKMVLFWHNHIPIEFWDLYNGRYSYRYMEQLYLHATGNFKALVKAITIDPAMLIYLNNTSSGKDAPDENYARELQELFCVGKGAGAGFTEDDVQSAARVLTGWRTDFAYPETYFHEQTHDTTDKQFSAFYNNTVITGRSGQAGMEELDDLLDMIFATDEVTLFLCRKL
ncbi:MAG: DUF1800 family protein, partial [Bacteroidota bacterium]